VNANKNLEIRNAASTLVLCVGIQCVFVTTFYLFTQIEQKEKPSLAVLLLSVATLLLSIVIFVMMRLRKKHQELDQRHSGSR